MALRGVKPKTIQKRLKALFYGVAGAGKTTASIQFPAPYYITTEKGAEHDSYTELLDKSNGSYFYTTDFDEVVKEVKSLVSESHEFKTLIIDPFTLLYDDLLNKSSDKNGTEFGRHYSDANRKVKHLLNLIERLDMNVIFTSYSKNEYGTGMSVLGQTFDGYKRLDYFFDLVFEIQKRGKKRVALVKKTRMENKFPEGEAFDFSYDSVAEKYGREILEKSSQTEILATHEQITELYRLIDLLKIPVETSNKWLDKCKSETFDEMPGECIQKCIDLLQSKLKGE